MAMDALIHAVVNPAAINWPASPSQGWTVHLRVATLAKCTLTDNRKVRWRFRRAAATSSRQEDSKPSFVSDSLQSATNVRNLNSRQFRNDPASALTNRSPGPGATSNRSASSAYTLDPPDNLQEGATVGDVHLAARPTSAPAQQAVNDNGATSLLKLAALPHGPVRPRPRLRHFSDHDILSNDLDQGKAGLGILSFLKSKHIFITGATGFLAKVLVEKILREQPDVGRLYLLIQPRNKKPEQRLQDDVINSGLFEVLRKTHGYKYQEFMCSKLTLVSGNITSKGLGIDQKLADEVAGKVEVIVNSAANTNFDARYDTALNINTLGPKRVLEFGKRCPRLQIFLHVSTAFVNGTRQGRTPEMPFRMGDSIAREKFGDDAPMLDLDKELEDAQRILDDLQYAESETVMTKVMTDFGLERAKTFGWQDTYVFTKAMGEMLIDQGRGNIPVAIVRPSVVESTLFEPFPGWMEGHRLAIGRGVHGAFTEEDPACKYCRLCEFSGILHCLRSSLCIIILDWTSFHGQKVESRVRMMDPVITGYGKGQLKGFLARRDSVLDVVPCDMVVNAILAAMVKHATQPGLAIYQVASSVVNPLTLGQLASILHEYFTTSPLLNSEGVTVKLRPIHFIPNLMIFKIFLYLNFTLPLQVRYVMKKWVEILGSLLSAKRRETYFNRLGRFKKSSEKFEHLAALYQPYTFYQGRFDITNSLNLHNELSPQEQTYFGFDVRQIDWNHYLFDIHIPGLRQHVMKGRFDS